MAFKDLLLLTGEGTEASTRYALWLAGLCGATLTAVCPVVGHLPSTYQVSRMPRDVVAHFREDAEDAARNVLAAFSENARQTAITTETLMFDTASADIGNEVSHLARYFDAAVLQQSESEGTDTVRIIEAVLLGSGRPVFIVPRAFVPQHLKSVMVGWDGGQPAARAVGDALPLLMMSDRVEVVTVGDVSRAKHMSSENMVRHLARHGIRAELTNHPRDGRDIAHTLLSHATGTGADLVVMGGYGHSRLREIMLGGTTRSILGTTTVPVLMSH
jgi:nucleotide-binding universal stress UspA family protein